MHGDEKDKADTIEGLIKSGHDVNEIDSYNLTPIYYAIRFNENPKVV